METPKTSEALNENGFRVNLNETLENFSGLSSFSENCCGLVSDPGVSVVQNGTGAGISSIHDVEVVNHTFDTENRVAGTIENGESCFDFGEIQKGSSVDEALGSMRKGDEEIALERVLATKRLNEIDASQLNGVDSGNSVEVSRKGISLFVDVFGPLEEFDQCDNSNGIGEQSNFKLEDEFKENGKLFHDSVENTSAIVSDVRESKQEVETISNQECKFSVGDFVWAKIKTKLWWPGLICDPSNASNDASKSLKERLVVQKFGEDGFVQCASRQLKPFFEYFEQMAKQSNSRSFLNAVDKAVGKIGMHVKLEITCSCFPVESRTQEGELAEYSVKRLEPANFLAYVKDLAKDVCVPGVIESTVAQSRLSAFYRAMGHRQLSMDQLLPTSDGANDKAHSESKSRERKVPDDLGEKNGKSENGYELRERRKSKFLNTANHVEMEMNNAGGRSVGSDQTVNSRSKKSKEKRVKKTITEASSVEMLSELRFTALDCLYPRESKRFDVAFRYFSGFRRINFNSNEQKLDTEVAKSEPCSVKVASGASDVNQMAEICATQKDPLEKGGFLVGVKPNKRRREKKERRISVGSKNMPTAELTNIEGEIATSGSVILDFRNTVPIKPEVRSVPKKRKKAEAVPASNIGDIITSGSVVIDFQKTGPSPAGQSVPRKRRKKARGTPASLPTTHTGVGLLDLNINATTNGPMIIDFQKNVPFSPEGQFVLENGTKNAEGTPVLPCIKEITDGSAFSGNSAGLLLEDLQFTGFAAPQGKLEPKRRKKKEKSKMKDFDGKSNVVLPDVKGSSAKFVPVLKDLPAKNLEASLKEATLSNMNVERNAHLMDVNGNNVEPGLLESKKRKRSEKKSEFGTKVASLLPDLNEITPEPNSTDSIMPKSQLKKRSKAAGNEVFDVNFSSTNKMQNDEEALGTALLLKFTDEFPVPAKETLVSTFCGFGQLKESETLALNESSGAQVVFMRSCDARDAFLSLKKCSPFGPALVNYRLHHLSSALEVDGNNMRAPMFLPVDGLNNPVKPKAPRKPRVPNKAKTAAKIEAPPVLKVPARVAFGLKGPQNEAPDISRIRQQLEMMTSMMEKAGDNLAPQMRAKLEGEINGLLKKIRTMSGSS